MGLEIYAVRNMTPVMPLDEWLEAHPGDYPENDNQFVMSRASYDEQEKVFPGRADGIVPDMVYEFDESEAEDFLMGGYGTYNGFRRTLDEFAEFEGAYERFEKVIHFSDCDGEMGPVVSAELVDAFSEHREGYKSFLSQQLGVDSEQVDRLLGYYDNMAQAFAIARDKGVVIFC